MLQVEHQQLGMREVLDDYVRYVTWDDDGRPTRLRLSQYPDAAAVIIDPRFGWGSPVLASSKVPVDVVLQLWRNGEPMAEVAAEYRLSTDVARVSSAPHPPLDFCLEQPRTTHGRRPPLSWLARSRHPRAVRQSGGRRSFSQVPFGCRPPRWSGCWAGGRKGRDEQVRRLELLDAVLAGIARHHEVADIVLASRSLTDAEAGLIELLDLQDAALARAVLDTQTRRLTLDERAARGTR